MVEYALYVESGPRQRKTMVHVLDLLGCIAQGPTTEAALANTPAETRTFLRFLQRHGAAVKPEESFTTRVAENVMEGSWLGNGDPTPGFSPDFQPLSTQDLALYLTRLDWLHQDLLELVRDIPHKKMIAEPKGSGRSIYRILDHIAQSQGVYLRYLVGKVDGLSKFLKDMQQGPEAAVDALEQLWQISSARLEVLTEEERKHLVKHGQVTWTARRALRRMLEHAWEHLLEISSRLDKPIG